MDECTSLGKRKKKSRFSLQYKVRSTLSLAAYRRHCSSCSWCMRSSCVFVSAEEMYCETCPHGASTHVSDPRHLCSHYSHYRDESKINRDFAPGCIIKITPHLIAFDRLQILIHGSRKEGKKITSGSLHVLYIVLNKRRVYMYVNENKRETYYILTSLI